MSLLNNSLIQKVAIATALYNKYKYCFYSRVSFFSSSINGEIFVTILYTMHGARDIVHLAYTLTKHLGQESPGLLAAGLEAGPGLQDQAEPLD